jgi:hypothetical protein
MGPKASLAPSGTTNESGHSPVTVGLLVKSVVIRFSVYYRGLSFDVRILLMVRSARIGR